MDEEIKKLVEENLKLTREIYKMTKKMKGYITFQKVMSFIYFLLIVVPIILSIIYLPPLINNMINQYNGLLGGEELNLGNLFKGGFDSKNIDINNLPPELQKEAQKYLNK